MKPKWIYAGLVSACLIISVCVLMIVKNGVSIRSAPYIKPTIIEKDLHIIADHLSLRLFPDFQVSDYWLFGFDLSQPEQQKTLDRLKANYEKRFNKNIQILNLTNHSRDTSQLEAAEIGLCKSPCWIVLSPNLAHQLSPNTLIERFILPTQKQYRTLTWFDFKRGAPVPDICVQEKRLTFECLQVVSVHEVEKKMKRPEARYFFLRKYLDQDYFLGVQSL